MYTLSYLFSTSFAFSNMAPTKKIRKPVPPAKFTTYSVPKGQKNFPCGILNVPAAQWTYASKVVSALDT